MNKAQGFDRGEQGLHPESSVWLGLAELKEKFCF